MKIAVVLVDKKPTDYNLVENLKSACQDNFAHHFSCAFHTFVVFVLHYNDFAFNSVTNPKLQYIYILLLLYNPKVFPAAYRNCSSFYFRESIIKNQKVLVFHINEQRKH